VRAGIAVDAALDEAAQAGVEPPTLAAILGDALQSGIPLRDGAGSGYSDLGSTL
jgi:hypothetical protein